MPSHGMGYIPDLPDQRDRHFAAPLRDIGPLPPLVDLAPSCPPIYDQGQLGACHDDQTDVLTDTGFKRFVELDGSERLATVDPKTAKLSFEVPTRLTRLHYSGPMYCARNRSLDFKVTPEHRMLVRLWDESARTLRPDFSFVATKDLGWYVGLLNRVRWQGEVQADSYTLPGVANPTRKGPREPRDVPIKAWARFLGLYVAEGTMLKRSQAAGRISYKIQIAAFKEREKVLVRETLDELGLVYLELADRFTFSTKQVYEAMAALGLEGVRAAEKFVPTFLFRQPAEIIEEFLVGHFAGDGSEQRGMRAHYTSSVRLAADLQALIFLSGNETRVTVRTRAEGGMTADGRTIQGHQPEHRVSVCERKNLSIDRKANLFTEEYDGDVFCAEVPTHHTLVTRRNGKILVAGNCTSFSSDAGYVYAAMKEGEAIFTPSFLFTYYYSRKSEGTVSSDAGASIRDTMKALAKIGVPDESLWPYDIAKFAERPPSAAHTAAHHHRSLQYLSVAQTLTEMKGCLAAGFPFVIGISVYESFESDEVAKTGMVPMPAGHEQLLGGHAMLVIGYRDAISHFKVRNSWGPEFGDAGHVWIPYPYLIDPNLSNDFWTIRLTS